MTVVLFPGAGSSADHSSLVAIEAELAPRRVERVDFPYRLAGRKAPDRAPVLMEAVRAALATVNTVDTADTSGAAEPGRRVVLGGRSMGGRICSMVVAGADGEPKPTNVAGLVLISYPLHPPGRPDRLRVEHLVDVTVPTLFISGDRDTFATPDELRDWTATMPSRAKVRHLFLEGLGHDLKGADHTIAGAVHDFVNRVMPNP